MVFCHKERRMNLIIVWSVVFVLALVCAILKKKLRIVSGLLLVFAITFFSLLTPNGKVLISLGSFNITEGALNSGLFKSGILLILQYFSKIVVSSKIKLPSKAGEFINEVFCIYEKLSQNEIRQIQHEEKEKEKVKVGFVKKITGVLEKIDGHLVQVWESL